MSSDFLGIKKKLPIVGVGLGLRRELIDEILHHSDSIDWLEFVPENYMGLGGMARERLETAGGHFPLVSHGVNLSIGSTDKLSQTYLAALKEVLDRTNSPWWSDHLCFTSVDGTYLHDLLPLPFTKEAVNHIAERIKRVQDFTQRPFLLENISFYMNMPGCEMTEAQFLAEVLEKADCGLLLDVNNVYVNASNHHFNPLEYLQQIPLERTVQMHVAGHKKIGDYIIDTHGSALIEPVYQLYEYVLQRTTVHGVLLERDQNFPPFKELLAELTMLKGIAARHNSALADAKTAAVSIQRRPITADQSGDKSLIASKQHGDANVDQRPLKGGRDLRALSA